MCWCTPSIRTPYCGKPNCQWPKKEGERRVTMLSDEQLDLIASAIPPHWKQHKIIQQAKQANHMQAELEASKAQFEKELNDRDAQIALLVEALEKLNEYIVLNDRIQYETKEEYFHDRNRIFRHLEEIYGYIPSNLLQQATQMLEKHRRYREALEFYASEHPPIGFRARQALGEVTV